MAAATTGAESAPGPDRGTPPVFIPCRNLPDSDTQYTVREICGSAEKTSGYGSVIGAQRIGGLWRLYPKSVKARHDLLLGGIKLRNQTISPFDKNPYIVRTPEGVTESRTTKLIIGNLPLSYSNEEIERKLSQLGCESHSKLMMERDRDENGGLTRWLTGRRFIYIAIPSQPLPQKVSIGSASVTLYHREQKDKPENSVCSRCFAKGHRAAICTNDVICRDCKQPGHKAGDPACTLLDSDVGEEGLTQKVTTEQANPDKPERQSNNVLPFVGGLAHSSTPGSAPTHYSPIPPPPTPMPPPNSSPLPVSPLTPRRLSGRRASDSTQAKINFPRSHSLPREKRPHSSPSGADDPAKSARIEDHADSLTVNTPGTQNLPSSTSSEAVIT